MKNEYQKNALTIVKQVQILTLLGTAAIIFTVALLLWNAQASRNFEKASQFHRIHSQTLRGIRNSVLSIKFDLRDQSSGLENDAVRRQTNNPHRVTRKLYGLETQIDHLIELDKTAPDASHTLHADRLLNELSPLLTYKRVRVGQPTDPAIAANVDAALVVLEQLDRLHLISLKQIQDLAKQASQWRIEVLFVLLAIAALLIGLVVRKTFVSLNLILEGQTASANNLRREKKLLQTTLQSIGNAVITTDELGKVTSLNPVAERLTGWTSSKALGKALKKIYAIIDTNTRLLLETPIGEILENGRTIHLRDNATLVSRDSAEYQIENSAAPIVSNGEILGMVLVFNDVTEQYMLRESLVKSKRDIQAILDNAPNVVSTKNLQGQYVFTNARYKSLFDLQDEDILGKTDYELFPAATADAFRNNDNQVLASDEPVLTEDIVPLADGPHIYNTVRFPLYDENGKAYGVCGISTDVTNSKKQDEIIRRSQKMDALGKLVGGVAHDYNNMLGVVIGYAGLLAEMPENSEKQKKYIDQIHHAARRGADLTKRLLKFSGRGAGEATALDINQLILDTRGLLGKTLTPKISIELQLEKELWLSFLDSNSLEDVILNLSINAMHAINENGTLTIQTSNQTLTSEHSQSLSLGVGDYVVLSISDTGCGMSQTVIDKIFDPFFTTKGDLGTGLGLSQVYGFVEQSGGTIAVDSKLGKGSRFDLYFPRFKNIPISDKEAETEPKFQHGGTESILLVDDEVALLELAAETIEQRGYKTFCATNAQDALKILASENIDLMVSDVVMPDMDGYQLASLVEQKYPKIKIQMASGYSDKRHLKIANQKLHAAKITKPYSASIILQRIRELLDSRELDSEELDT